MWPGRSCSRVGELGRGDVAIICLSPVVRQRAAYHLARPGAREPTAARLTMLRHPSWNGLDKPSSIDLYRDSSCDIEEACCNRRRSHSHDLPDAWDRRRRCVLIGAAGLLLFLGVAAASSGRTARFPARPAPPPRASRVLLADDDGSLHLSAPPASDGEASRYDSLLESNFGPPPAVAREVNGTRKQSKTRRKREEKHKIAAEKRRLAQELENSEDDRAATDRRRRERLERKEAEREAKREKREVTAVMNGGTLARTR